MLGYLISFESCEVTIPWTLFFEAFDPKITCLPTTKLTPPSGLGGRRRLSPTQTFEIKLPSATPCNGGHILDSNHPPSPPSTRKTRRFSIWSGGKLQGCLGDGLGIFRHHLDWFVLATPAHTWLGALMFFREIFLRRWTNKNTLGVTRLWWVRNEVPGFTFHNQYLFVARGTTTTPNKSGAWKHCEKPELLSATKTFPFLNESR